MRLQKISEQSNKKWFGVKISFQCWNLVKLLRLFYKTFSISCISNSFFSVEDFLCFVSFTTCFCVKIFSLSKNFHSRESEMSFLKNLSENWERKGKTFSFRISVLRMTFISSDAFYFVCDIKVKKKILCEWKIRKNSETYQKIQKFKKYKKKFLNRVKVIIIILHDDISIFVCRVRKKKNHLTYSRSEGTSDVIHIVC